MRPPPMTVRGILASVAVAAGAAGAARSLVEPDLLGVFAAPVLLAGLLTLLVTLVRRPDP